MCGISGGYWRSPPVQLKQQMNESLLAMRRRGPDHRSFELISQITGTVVLGHTRLSIIDLTASAQQPMYSADLRYALVFNGEIYNYLELREELVGIGAIFRTNSDTEVLLQAWQRWGLQALNRLKGMFAFVVYDRQEQTLTCVRDAFGIKPFFYAIKESHFCFASELAAITPLMAERASLNWQRAYDYLVHGEYDFGEDCFVEGVRTLMPGHLLTVDLNSGRASEPEAWWRPSIVQTADISFAEASERLRDLFLDSVRLHLRSDVPLGAALSGGVDSSAIVCAMRYLEPDANIHTFSYIARGSLVSEEAWVDKVNGHVGASPNKIVVSAQELLADLPDLIAAQGEPFGSTSIYAQYRVFQEAKAKGITVTLEGQGADELHGGYIGYPGQRMRSMLDEASVLQAWRFLTEWSQWPGRNRLEGLKRLVGEFSHGRVHDMLRAANGMQSSPDWIRADVLREGGVRLGYPGVHGALNVRGRRLMCALASSVSQRGLLGLLRHGDRNSMRFSVESRVPFLTTDMADFMFSLPEHYLVSPSGETKHLLRASLRGIVPDEVLYRRDKVGFATPEQQWLVGMADVVRPWLKTDLGLPFLDQSKLLAQFEEVVAGRRPYSWQVWRWINFALWYRNLL
ncbi:asparagine synthase (glutamine-hydrolyzing) [Ectopseudomonas khazarica]|uniref:asparagine synthase (glutamine-hydrolyzing) n=1 Tax=Ectopseudomonas khazarica TaxID=2502979 RepID=UPI003B960D0A